MKNLILVIWVGLFAGSAFAKSAVDECLDKAMSNMDMYDCQKAELARQDKRLNTEYKKLVDELKKDNSNEGKEIIDRTVKAQRIWILFRDASCDLESAQMLGGSGQGLVSMDCTIRFTKERADYIIQLQKMFLSADGGAQLN